MRVCSGMLQCHNIYHDTQRRQGVRAYECLVALDSMSHLDFVRGFGRVVGKAVKFVFESADRMDVTSMRREFGIE